MKGDALYRIIGGIALLLFSVAVPIAKFHGRRDIVGTLSADGMLVIGCLAIALLGVVVAAAGMRSLKKLRIMTERISRMVNEQSRVITKEVAEAVGLHETEVRERIDEMIAKREIPAGTTITYVRGEKIVT